MWTRAGGTITSHMEQGGLACFRFSFEGSRSVIAASFAQLGRFVRAQQDAKAMKAPISVWMTSTWLQNCCMSYAQSRALACLFSVFCFLPSILVHSYRYPFRAYSSFFAHYRRKCNLIGHLQSSVWIGSSSSRQGCVW